MKQLAQSLADTFGVTVGYTTATGARKRAEPAMNQPQSTTDYDPAYWQALRYHRGDVPKRVDEARWWDMIGVMYPRNWRHSMDDTFEVFALNEMQTADLYTWFVRIGKSGTPTVEYWEMIAPDRSTDKGLLARIAKAKDAAAR